MIKLVFNINFKILEMVPFVVISFGIFATVLAYKGIDFLYWAVFFLGVLALLLFKRHKLNIDISILMSLFLFNICMLLISSIVFSPMPEDIIKVLVHYFLTFSYFIAHNIYVYLFIGELKDDKYN